MKGTLYVLCGPSGAGKTTIVSAAMARHPERFTRIVKRSTRPSRPDDVDTTHVQSVDLRENSKELVYLTNGGKYYLVSIEEIGSVLASGKSALLIVNQLMTIRVLRNIIPNMRVVFVHREFSRDVLKHIFEVRGLKDERLVQAIEQRTIARSLLYHQVAAGVLQPDHVIINDTVGNAVDQMMTIDEADPSVNASSKSQRLNIIMAGTGPAKDLAIRFVETIPGGGRLIVPKYLTRERRDDDGCETINVDAIPERCVTYDVFGKKFGLDPSQAIEIVQKNGVGFVTISHHETALELVRLVHEVGLGARIIYLHQPNTKLDYEPDEARRREAHAASLLQMYQQELVALPDVPVILAESEDVLCVAIQRLCLHAFI